MALARNAPTDDSTPGLVSRLILSPHLDDGAFSCGGSIHARTRAGLETLVVTLFTASAPPETELSPLARSLHQQWGIEGDIMAERRREDRSALARLGAELSHGELLEALYRSGPGGPLYTDSDALFGELVPEDEETVDAVAEELTVLLQGRLTRDGEVLAPLGVGGHVDHRLVRRAAERVVPAERLWLYEDFPYARHPVVLRRRLGWRRWRWHSRRERLGSEDVEARCAASAAYASQWTTAFADREQLDRSIRRFVRQRGGERLWRTKSSA